MSSPLTARQESFCRGYVLGTSAAEAARRAGYSAATARSQAWRLLKDARVQARIDELRGDAEAAQGALCAELWAQVETIREAALADRAYGAALRAVTTQLKLVERLGLPARPADSFDILLDGAAAEAEAEAEVDAEAQTEADAGAADDTPLAGGGGFVLTDVDAGDVATGPADAESVAADAESMAEVDGPLAIRRSRAARNAVEVDESAAMQTLGDGDDVSGAAAEADRGAETEAPVAIRRSRPAGRSTAVLTSVDAAAHGRPPHPWPPARTPAAALQDAPSRRSARRRPDPEGRVPETSPARRAAAAWPG